MFTTRVRIILPHFWKIFRLYKVHAWSILLCKNVIKVLDDFLFVGESFQECLYTLNSFKHLCRLIGVPLADHKTVGPTSCLTFLGIEIDLKTAEARIRIDKIES